MSGIPEIVNEAVEAAGCEVVQLKQPNRTTVHVMVDREPDGVGVDDLSRLTRALHEAFEQGGLDPGEFAIEVLSPGLDRPLVRDKDFVRFAGSLHSSTSQVTRSQHSRSSTVINAYIEALKHHPKTCRQVRESSKVIKLQERIIAFLQCHNFRTTTA